MTTTQTMQKRAKLRKTLSKTQQESLWINRHVRIYEERNLSRFSATTGRLPLQFEGIEYAGMDLCDQMLSGMFETEVSGSKEFYVGSWKDCIVEVTGRQTRDSREYFAIRLGSEDITVSRPAYHDTLVLTGIEAAFARFAISANSISWYAHNQQTGTGSSLVNLGMGGFITGEQAADYYHMAMFAADSLGLSNVYSVLD